MSVFMINPRGRRISVELENVELLKTQGWVFKPDAKEEYYPELDSSLVPIDQRPKDGMEGENAQELEILVI